MRKILKGLLVATVITGMISAQTFAYTSYFNSSYSSTIYFNDGYVTSYAPEYVIPIDEPEPEFIPEPVVTPEPIPEPVPVVAPVPEPVAPVQPLVKMTIVKIAQGTKYETPMYVFDSGISGKTVWINGGTHGNETSGYKAALQFLDQVKSGSIKIKSGKLIILPEANIIADRNHTRTYEGVNLNRVFPMSTSEPDPTYTLAKAIWAQLIKYHPEYFLDLHVTVNYHLVNSDNTGQSIIYMPIKDGKTVANSIITELNKKITNPIAKYSALRYPVPGSIARATSECLGTVSFIAEACDNETLTTRINNHVNTCKYLLKFVGMI